MLIYFFHNHLKGSVIQATIFKKQFLKFKAPIQEGCSYMIISPTIGGMKYPTFTLCGQQQKLTLIRTKNIKKCTNFFGLTFSFSFADYQSIFSDQKPEPKSIS